MESQTHEILYARVKLPCHPNGKRLHITNDCKQIFYYNKTEKVNVKTYPDLYTKYTYNFIDSYLSTDDKGEWGKIILKIDLNKLNEIVNQPYNLNMGRKNLFNIFKKCYDEVKNNYISHSILNLCDNILKKNNNSFAQFLKEDEPHNSSNSHTPSFNKDEPQSSSNSFAPSFNKDEYSYLPNNIYKLGDNYIDLCKGKFLKSVQFNKMTKNGGILYDANCTWIEKLIEHIEKSNKKIVKEKIVLINTKCSLIICDKSMCMYWITKITIINKNAKAKLINTKKDFKDLTYDDVSQLDYIILNCDFLISKNYTCIMDEYKMGCNSYDEIMDIIIEEYGNYENIKEMKNILFSLFKWNNLVIDYSSLNVIIENNTFMDIILTLKSNSKWIQIEELFPSKEKYSNLFKLLIGNVSFPLYDSKMNIKFFNPSVFVFVSPITNMTINEKCIKIQTTQLEKKIVSYFDKMKINDINKIQELINIIYENTITRQKYVDIMDDLSASAEFNNLTCPICLTSDLDYDKLLYTKCGHYYCIECLLQNLHYTNNCSLCRSTILLNDIYYLMDNTNHNKINEMVKMIGQMDKNIIIYTNSIKSKKSVLTYLKQYNIKESKSQINWIYPELSKHIITINYDSSTCENNVIIYDLNDDIDIIKKQLQLNNITNHKIYYLIYDILYERISLST